MEKKDYEVLLTELFRVSKDADQETAELLRHVHSEMLAGRLSPCSISIIKKYCFK
jgi:hypothetical protein